MCRSVCEGKLMQMVGNKSPPLSLLLEKVPFPVVVRQHPLSVPISEWGRYVCVCHVLYLSDGPELCSWQLQLWFLP